MDVTKTIVLNETEIREAVVRFLKEMGRGDFTNEDELVIFMDSETQKVFNFKISAILKIDE